MASTAGPSGNNGEPRSLGQHIATRLVQIGVSEFFGVPGYAADGYARAKGVGCCVVTFTVGGLSAINAIAGAYAENLPVICICGGPNSNDFASNRLIHHTLGRKFDFMQELNCFKEVTAEQVVIHSLADAHEEIDKAISAAVFHSKPVYICVCCNLAGLHHPSFDSSPIPYSLSTKQSNPRSLEAAVEAAAAFLGGKQKPVALAGSLLRVGKAQTQFLEFVKAAGYPFANMAAAKGLVPESSEQYMGTYWGQISAPYVSEVVESADAYLVAGPLLNDYASVGYTLGISDARMVRVDPYRVTIAGGKGGQMFGCVRMDDFLAGLAQHVKGSGTSLDIFRRLYTPPPEVPPSPSGSPLQTKVLFKHVQGLLQPSTLLLAETGDSIFNCQKLRLPDGCQCEWLMTAQEVSTMLRYGANPIIVLINNGGPYNKIKNWDYVKLVQAMHNEEGALYAVRVGTEEELAEAFSYARNEGADKLCFIECMIHRDDCSAELLEWGSRGRRLLEGEVVMKPAVPGLGAAAEQSLVVTSDEVVTSLVFSVIGGVLFLGLWVVARRPLRRVFLRRMKLSDVPARPPPLDSTGFVQRCFSYFGPVFFMSDGEFAEAAGLDALMMMRFLVLGCHILTPLAVMSCAIILPICLSGKFVNSSNTVAGMASVMRYSVSNLAPKSSKLWACFALSYVALAWAGYCLYMHYKSYALLRLVYLRFSAPRPAGAAPVMRIVGFERRGWPAARQNLLKLISPFYMLRSDAAYVKRFLEERAADEAAAVAAGTAGSLDEQCSGKEDGSENGIVPFWLPPEHMPVLCSAELGSCMPAGKTCPPSRNRAVGWTEAGQPVWVPAEQYAVLFQAAGPLPSKELWSLLRPRSAVPTAVHIDSSSPANGASNGDSANGASGGEHAPAAEDKAADAAGPTAAADHAAGGVEAAAKKLGQKAMDQLQGSEAKLEGYGADLVADQLTHALQELFPASFTSLVCVHNHMAADCLLVKYDAAAAKRDRWTSAAAAARLRLKALGESGFEGEEQKGSEGFAGEVNGKAGITGQASGSTGLTGWKCRNAAKRLARAEAEEAKWRQSAADLAEQVETARQAALAKPLGTAFIALFKDQASAAIAASDGLTLVPGVNLTARPAPGPDNINWAALWSTWGQRILRGLAVIPFLVFWMVFPIGVLTGALTNLNTAVCSGTSDTNSIYWPWYCEQTDFWARLLKGLLQGLLPPIISMAWDTFVMPIMLWTASQSERRHAALSDLDRRITVLFFNFDLFNTFLGSVLGGAIFQQIGNMVDTPGYWLQMLGTSLPAASTYFLNYCLVGALSSNFSRFIWPHAGVCLTAIFSDILRLTRPTTERDAFMQQQVPSVRAPRSYAKFLLVMIMGLSYAVTAPLVLPAAAGFFFTAWLVWRYHCLYFYERQYESGGRLFETLFTLMVWTLATFSIFTGIILAAKQNYTAALIMVFTQLPALLVYHKKVVLSTRHFAQHLPLQSALHAPRAVVDPAAYVPPPLRPGAVGWQPEWGKVWSCYGLGRYSF
ncbi:pyruvate decarboxylase 4 [Chlorella sorokiniana]|uniref:pyruvate decarboxylase n=1 Tax=Chlorella sorokiniana TaxID=3076 RepID=A0A2P6TJX4_CHLSO|nr:pyruvate decarboxylase 4 [Chlorella sorokiniana]|eukprot:PRW44348.1 pyruvate decarboxylase 4 [Chlorella sorokiniana]